MTVHEHGAGSSLRLEPFMRQTILRACKACRAKHPLHPDQPLGLDPTVCAECGEPMTAPEMRDETAKITSLAPWAIIARICLRAGRVLFGWAKGI